MILYYIEFSHLAEDVSDGPNSLIPDRSVLTLSLTDPNPPVTGNYIQGGTMHEISWSITGSTSDILRFDVYWSMNSGASWNSVAAATAFMRGTKRSVW